MAWDTERTKRLLLDAATAEFSEHGLAGARVDRIAAPPGSTRSASTSTSARRTTCSPPCSATRLRASMDEVPMLGDGAEAVGDYAGRLFDHHLADGVIPRLVFWEGLERGSATAADAARAAVPRGEGRAVPRLLPGGRPRRRRRAAAHHRLARERVAGARPPRRASSSAAGPTARPERRAGGRRRHGARPRGDRRRGIRRLDPGDAPRHPSERRRVQ